MYNFLLINIVYYYLLLYMYKPTAVTPLNTAEGAYPVEVDTNISAVPQRSSGPRVQQLRLLQHGQLHSAVRVRRVQRGY